MAKAILYRENDGSGPTQVTAPAAGSGGDIIQLPDGRAAVVTGLKSFASGDQINVYTSGQFEVLKLASVVCLPGGNAFYNRSAGTVTPLRGTGRFWIGTFVADAASADATAIVDLNVKQANRIDWSAGIWDTAIVKTSGAPYVTRDAAGSNVAFAFTTTAEAQKVDALSSDSIPITVGCILDARLAVFDIGDANNVDISVGLANATHATDADSITESAFIHLDGAALDIYAESDDGTTEVAATDTTVNAVDDTYFELWIDARVKTALKFYINGVRVLSSTEFKLNAATGPLKGLVHMEKTSNDTPGEIRVEYLNVRSMDVVS